jgi:hypothetical protein
MKNNKTKKRDTYRSYIFKKTLNRFKLFKKNTKVKDDTNNLPRSPYGSAQDAPMHIAFIVDGIVEDIIHCDERFGYLLISDPLIIKLENYGSVKINDIYDEEAGSFKSDDEI